MRLNVLRTTTKGEGTLQEFLPKQSRFFRFLQSTRGLTMITCPHIDTCTGSSGNDRGFFNVTVLLTLVSESEGYTSLLQAVTGLYDCVHSCWKPPPHPMRSLLCLRTSCLLSEVTSGDVLLALFFFSSIYPTSRPILEVTSSGRPNDSICSAKACAATFSLVRIISLRFGSKTSKPTTRIAADRVLPAPNTPLRGRSVRPSRRARTRADNVARTCSSGLHRSG